MESDDDSLAKPGEVVASTDEVCDAVRDLSDPDQRRLAKVGGVLLRHYPELARQWEPRELLHMAVIAALDPNGRKWPKQRVDIVKFLAEAMRSIAFNAARKIKGGTEISLIPESDLRATGGEDRPGSVLESLGEAEAGVEADLIGREDEAKKEASLAVFRAQLAAEDEKISRILELRLQGFSKAEIRKQLGMSDTTYWTADRRLSRRIEQFLEKLKNDESQSEEEG